MIITSLRQLKQANPQSWVQSIALFMGPKISRHPGTRASILIITAKTELSKPRVTVSASSPQKEALKATMWRLELSLSVIKLLAVVVWLWDQIKSRSNNYSFNLQQEVACWEPHSNHLPKEKAISEWPKGLSRFKVKRRLVQNVRKRSRESHQICQRSTVDSLIMRSLMRLHRLILAWRKVFLWLKRPRKIWKRTQAKISWVEMTRIQCSRPIKRVKTASDSI